MGRRTLQAVVQQIPWLVFRRRAELHSASLWVCIVQRGNPTSAASVDSVVTRRVGKELETVVKNRGPGSARTRRKIGQTTMRLVWLMSEGPQAWSTEPLEVSVLSIKFWGCGIHSSESSHSALASSGPVPCSRLLSKGAR